MTDWGPVVAHFH